MIEEHSSRAPIPLILAALLLYVFLFARPVSTELSLKPRWADLLSEVKAGPTAGTGTLSFRTDSFFGYFRDDGTVAASSPVPAGLFAADKAYAAAFPEAASRQNPFEGGFAVFKPDGTGAFKVQGAQSPFLAADRLFGVGNDGATVSEFGEAGNLRWKYSFPAPVTAFAVSPTMVAAGLADGWIEGIDAFGKQVLSFAPGGSRLPVILGLDVSASGQTVAAISGIDKQRLVILRKTGSAYRVARHLYLDTDFRGPVSVRFLPDERYVLYARKDGIGLFDIERDEDWLLPVVADTFEAGADGKHGLNRVFARSATGTELVVFSPPATVIGRVRIPARYGFVRGSGSHVYLGSGERLAGFDMVEE